MAKTFVTKIMPLTVLLIAAVVVLVPMQSDVSVIDFDGYYNDAGSYDILKDPELAGLLSLSVFADVDVTTSHAAERHADDMALYNKCNDGGNAVMMLVDPDNDHCVEVLEASVDGKERWLVRVVKQVNGRWREITAFSDEWATVCEVEEYLVNGGYMYVWP